MNDILALNFNKSALPKATTLTYISDRDFLPISLLWVVPLAGLFVWGELIGAHGMAISVIVGIAAAIALAATILGVFALVMLCFREEKVWFCEAGVILIKARRLNKMDWFEIP